MRLTAEQLRAVRGGSSVVVTAGAGTGKTQVLTERYLFHLFEDRLSPLEVVAITFTRRAAGELRARIRRRIGEEHGERSGPPESDRLAEIEAAPIGTIHSLCARICRDHPRESGAPAGFEILDEASSHPTSPDLPDQIDAALDRLPPEVYRVIPFTLTRRVMAALLTDPVMATRAFDASSGSAGELLDRWARLGQIAREEAIDAMLRGAGWTEGISRLRRVSGSGSDAIEVLRRRALELADQIEADRRDPERWLQVLAEITLRGGSGRNWPSGGLEEVKSTLKQLRETALRTLAAWRNFSLSAVDQDLARIIPTLRQAFDHVRAETGRARRAARQIDYSDLEAMAWQALQSEPVRRHYHQRWRAILVDEFQDTSQIQAEIIELLAANARLTIVGDEKQSIYGFRGAEVTIFRGLRERIIADGGMSQELSISFRSHAGLVDGLNRIFERVQAAEHRPLAAHRAEAPHIAPPLRFFIVEAQKGVAKALRQRTEARNIASVIREMIDTRLAVHDRVDGNLRPVKPGDIAILTRSWAPLEVFNELLTAVDIPAAIVGGGDLLQTREAMDLIALIRFLANPADNLALITLLRSPFFAVSDRTLQLAAAGREQRINWWRRIEASDHAELKRAAAILRTLLDQRPSASPESLIRRADRLTGYSAVIAGLPNAARRLADWNAMLEWVREEQRSVAGDIFQFWRRQLWRRLRRRQERGVTISRPSIEAQDAVSLLTIHSAKGLEWPIVVVPDLSGGRGFDDHPVLFDQDHGVALRLHASDDEEDDGSAPVLYSWLAAAQSQRREAESRRLLYVALTRARDAVILSAADRTGGLLSHLAAGLDGAGIAAEAVDHHTSDGHDF